MVLNISEYHVSTDTTYMGASCQKKVFSATPTPSRCCRSRTVLPYSQTLFWSTLERQVLVLLYFSRHYATKVALKLRHFTWYCIWYSVYAAKWTSWESVKIFPLSHRVQSVSGAHPVSYQVSNGGTFPRVKWPEREGGRSPRWRVAYWNTGTLPVHLT